MDGAARSAEAEAAAGSFMKKLKSAATSFKGALDHKCHSVLAETPTNKTGGREKA